MYTQQNEILEMFVNNIIFIVVNTFVFDINFVKCDEYFHS